MNRADGRENLRREARRLSHMHHGKRLAIHVPGMFTAYGKRGRYPAVSLTGKRCDLGCEHCGGILLNSMHSAETPEELLKLGREFSAGGELGMLISGGSDENGRLPLKQMLPVISELTESTDLTITCHVARLDRKTARGLKEAGVKQALVDVVGDETTAREVLHQDGLAWQEETLDSLAWAGLEMAPHIILGLYHGGIRGESKALEILRQYNPSRVIFVLFMPLKGSAMQDDQPIAINEAADFLAKARLVLPKALHHLGCARPRGRYRREVDYLAVKAGINVLALPSDGALRAAEELGLTIDYRETCCSLADV